ncbi:TRAP transporter substrate-binding protein [Paracoccus sp. (in: a-proteobacteria)]|uniref:TRAP transporter substrate-binding protein n=1 Tax=Paracoccus sp. TaxID=267 RepID=UPI002B0032AE|nr:TRAP transporter substrate-binding protein [Paracoccus sp. (in: a-proteobacteria)]
MKAFALLLAGSALIASTLTATAQETIRVAGNFAAEHASSLAMEVFRTELEDLTDGSLTAQIFPAQQLGGAAENVQGVRIGAIELIWVGTAYLTRTVPELEALSLPFQYANREEAFTLADGPVGDALDEKLAAHGLTSLGYMELGFRHVTNNRGPIESMEDFAGLRIRLQPNETHLATFRALGANPLAMDVGELYSALEQGVIDGQENPFAIINASGYAGVQKYVSNTGHFYDFISVIANRDRLAALSPEHQQAIREAMATAITYQRQLAAEQEVAALTLLQDAGMTYTPLTEELVAEMRAATASVADEAAERIGADMVAVLADSMAAPAN